LHEFSLLPSVTTPISPAIEVEALVKRFGTIEALRGIDFVVPCGEIFGLLGPNGAGKTTLFSILATLRTPTAGRARVMGSDVVTQQTAVRQAMAIVFQEPAIDLRLSGRDNLLLMGLFFCLSGKMARQRAGDLLDQLGLAQAGDRPAGTLSGGQRRKLELARALVSNPQVLFLDEATLGLDVDGRRGFWSAVRALAATGRTVFFTTHYLDEAEIAQRIGLIDKGKIVALDTPQALKARVGGVLALRTDDNARACEWLRAHDLTVENGEGELRLRLPDPAAVVADILRHLPVKVQRVETHGANLEDVFLQFTGRGLDTDTPASSDSSQQSTGGRF
jgi:ABC-2 type transport system ATP-binding protein